MDAIDGKIVSRLALLLWCALAVPWTGPRPAGADDLDTDPVPMKADKHPLPAMAVPGRIFALALAPDGSEVAVSASDGISVWDLHGFLRVKMTPPGDPPLCLSFSHDGRRLAGGDAGGTTAVWELGGGKLVWSSTLNVKGIRDICFAPDDSTLLTASDATAAELWDAGNGHLLRSFLGTEYPVRRVAFSSDGSTVTTIALPDGDGHVAQVNTWDTASGHGLTSVLIRDIRTATLALSHDGQSVLADRILSPGSVEELSDRLMVFSAATGAPLVNNEDALGVQSGSFAFSGDDKVVVGWDGAMLSVYNAGMSAATASAVWQGGSKITNVAIDANNRVAVVAQALTPTKKHPAARGSLVEYWRYAPDQHTNYTYR